MLAMNWYARPEAPGRIAERATTKRSFRGLNRSSFQNSDGQLRSRTRDAMAASMNREKETRGASASQISIHRPSWQGAADLNSH